MACLCARPAHEHRAISQARGPAARTQRALKLATAALAATAGVPAPKPHLPASRLASALTLCASDSVSRCRLQRCELPILMLMLALLTIGLLALRCVDSSRETESAQGPPSATERRECKSRVALLLRDADSGQIDHMAAEPTHGPHHPCTSSSRLGARGTLLASANGSLNGGSTPLTTGLATEQ